jgi:hypothetical protein
MNVHKRIIDGLRVSFHIDYRLYVGVIWDGKRGQLDLGNRFALLTAHMGQTLRSVGGQRRPYPCARPSSCFNSWRGKFPFRTSRRAAISALVFFAIGGAAFSAETPADKLKARMSNLSEIPLHLGVNEVDLAAIVDAQKRGSGPAAIFKKGTIIVARVDLPNVNSKKVYMTVGPNMIPEDGPWSIIPIEAGASGGGVELTVFDQLEMGYDAQTTVHFFKGRLDRVPTLFLIIANQDSKHGTCGLDGCSEPTDVSLFVLRYHLDAVLESYADLFFSKEGDFRSSKKYCNADEALSRELSLPLLDTQYLSFSASGGC